MKKIKKKKEDENKENPFFLYFATTNIHHPFTPAPRFKGTSQAGLYGDYIHELDWMVGELVKSLEENGLTENTMIIFTSDNGKLKEDAQFAQLYDLKADPNQTQNVYAENREVAAKMDARLKELRDNLTKK